MRTTEDVDDVVSLALLFPTTQDSQKLKPVYKKETEKKVFHSEFLEGEQRRLVWGVSSWPGCWVGRMKEEQNVSDMTASISTYKHLEQRNSKNRKRNSLAF